MVRQPPTGRQSPRARGGALIPLEAAGILSGRARPSKPLRLKIAALAATLAFSVGNLRASGAMVARIHTVAFQGVDVLDVDVQVQIASGLPAFAVVGLPDKAVAESRERVRGALGALGLALPAKRITVNLAPADLVKEGSHFDLPNSLRLLVAMGVLPADQMERD